MKIPEVEVNQSDRGSSRRVLYIPYNFSTTREKGGGALLYCGCLISAAAAVAQLDNFYLSPSHKSSFGKFNQHVPMVPVQILAAKENN